MAAKQILIARTGAASVRPIHGLRWIIAGLIFLGETLTLVQWSAIASIVAASAGSAATRELVID